MRPFTSRSTPSRPAQGDVVRARLDALLAELDPQDAPAASAPDPGPGPGSGSGPGSGPGPGPDREPPAAVLRRAWEFGRAHAAVIGVVALVALLGAVWAISQARTVPVAVAAPTAVPPAQTPAASPSPDPAPEPLRVHVLGAVATPGVVRLPPGSRVEDAIAAAGGLTERARPGELNLAALVADGAQVVVGDARNPGGEVRAGGEAGGIAGDVGTPGAVSRLDLNTATAAQMEALPGVGPVTARAILAWREQHQRFSRVEELLEIDGIGPKTFARLEPLVRV